MTKFIPEIKEIIHEFQGHPGAEHPVAALPEMLHDVQNGEGWKWPINKEDPAIAAERQKRQDELKERYK